MAPMLPPRWRDRLARTLKALSSDLALYHIAVIDPDPSAINRPHRPPEQKTLLGGHRNQLASPLLQAGEISGERQEPRAVGQLTGNDGGCANLCASSIAAVARTNAWSG